MSCDCIYVSIHIFQITDSASFKYKEYSISCAKLFLRSIYNCDVNYGTVGLHESFILFTY